jgi:hypothetical protein
MNKRGRTKGQLWRRTETRESDAMIWDGGFGRLMRGIEAVVMFGGREIEIPDEICSAQRRKWCLLWINTCLEN